MLICKDPVDVFEKRTLEVWPTRPSRKDHLTDLPKIDINGLIHGRGLTYLPVNAEVAC